MKTGVALDVFARLFNKHYDIELDAATLQTKSRGLINFYRAIYDRPVEKGCIIKEIGSGRAAA
jgi:hypothetical protein